MGGEWLFILPAEAKRGFRLHADQNSALVDLFDHDGKQGC